MDKASRRLPDDNELLVLHDVTAEVCLRQATAVVATFRNLPGVILVTVTMNMCSHLDVEGDVLGVTGYTSDEFLALDPSRDFLSPDIDRAKITSLFASVVDPNQSFAEVNIPYVHKKVCIVGISSPSPSPSPFTLKSQHPLRAQTGAHYLVACLPRDAHDRHCSEWQA